ncbi:MAG TPA: hypothetical protein VNU46_03985 [Gemmatimonadaceae bacterium]|jgi:hypothetical protein|nr:hypothetical protein [Gemmatimonadaceae bacterium]
MRHVHMRGHLSPHLRAVASLLIKPRPRWKVARDAGTGRFITMAEARRRPKTTVVETMKICTCQ